MLSPSPFTTLRARLEAALFALREGTSYAAVKIEVPGGFSSEILDLKLTDYTVYFSSESGSGAEETLGFDGTIPPEHRREPIQVGVGAVEVLRLEGPRRFEEAQVRARAVYDQLDAAPELLPQLRFFGGAAFSPGRDGAGPCWKAFGDASFVLPRLLYVDHHSRADLILISSRETSAADLRLAEELLVRISQPKINGKGMAIQALSRSESEAPPKWKTLVESIQGSIESGALSKVVAARRVTLKLSGAPVLSDVIERLYRQAPRCAHFALRVKSRTFIGATPERLVRRAGTTVLTEALAGSISRSLPEAPESLLASEKDQQEHSYVVHAIESALAPLCEELVVPKAPTVRELSHILHLRTPITGHLKHPVHVLALVERLHPTPAVGGLPRQEAIAFIDTHEQAERGWYAAPLGWMNASGDGEFVVALRSGLVCDDIVHLYAGAGIVVGSSAEAEYEETELKLSGMLEALGLAS